MAAADRLSDLPDDLLLRVLHFTPAKEAASTTLLSRRYRHLWPTSSTTVNLDTRSYDRSHGPGFTVPKRDAFLRAAAAALAEGRVVTTLTLHVDAGSYFTAKMFLSLRGRHDLVATVLALPAARGIEELRVSAAHSGPQPSEQQAGGLYRLHLASLPSAALRVLHLVNCSELIVPAADVAFPWLTQLRLQGCTASLGDLQGFIDSAPRLDALHMENSSFTASTRRARDDSNCTLRCQTCTTVLVLENCSWPGWEEGDRHLDMPRLRHFRHDSSSIFALLTSVISSSPNDGSDSSSNMVLD